MNDDRAENQQYWTGADVARRLRLTPARIRQLAIAGQLQHTRTLSGTRLYERDDVERYARQRAGRTSIKAATGDGQ